MSRSVGMARCVCVCECFFFVVVVVFWLCVVQKRM